MSNVTGTRPPWQWARHAWLPVRGKKRDYPKVAPGSWLAPVAVKVIDSVGVGGYVSVVLDVLQRVLNVEE